MPPARKTPAVQNGAAGTEIDIDRVEAVLLADGWHQVFPQTFNITGLRFVHATNKKASAIHDGGTAFTLSERTSSGEIQRVAGPVSSILALRYSRPSDEREE